jgi:TolB protein
VLTLASGALKRITQNPATDTEPVWSEDGRDLIYLSDRSGSAQIYRVDADGGRAERLSFEGRYNASPAIVPGSDLLVLLHANEGKYRVATLDPARGQVQLLSGNPLDESPSVAPNGTMVAYATIQGDRGVLEIVSIDGRIRQKVSLGGQDIREPAWSPYLP